jgi:hypothetical protein
MKFKQFTSKFTSAALKNMGLLGPLLFCAALSVTVTTISQYSATRKPRDSVKMEVTKQYVDSAQLKNVAEKLAANFPGLIVEMSSDNKFVVVKGQKDESWTDFNYALAATFKMADGILWESRQICLKECTNNVKMAAEIRGFRQNITKINN